MKNKGRQGEVQSSKQERTSEEYASSSEEDSPKSNNVKKNVKPTKWNWMVCANFCLTFVAFYFILYLVIAYFYNQPVEAETTIAPKEGPKGLETCGANSFMLRDSICDEVTNTEVCLYDGGDCCLEAKIRTQCKDCSCKAVIEPEKILKQFKDLSIEPIKVNGEEQLLIDIKVANIEEVVSNVTCAVICLEHQKRNDINVWQYHAEIQLCRCGWMKSQYCPKLKVLPGWKLGNIDAMNESSSYIQLAKTVPCECLALDFQVNSQNTDQSDWDALKEASFVMTAWHCKMRCEEDYDCQWFSWKHDDNDLEYGKCLLLKELPKDSTVYTAMSHSPGWLSSAKECSLFQQNFRSYWDEAITETRFVCPSKENETVTELDLGHNIEDFLVVVSDTTSMNTIEVLRVDQKTVVECVHNLLAPEEALTDATGGVLLHEKGSYLVICGGRAVGTEAENDRCFSLHDQTTSDLSMARLGAASLAIDSGRSLWITGGYSKTTGDLFATEVLEHHQVSVSKPGPFLPIQALRHHCLEKIDASTALLIGGENYHTGVAALTWYYELDKDASTTVGPQLNHARSRHACGVLKDQTMPNSAMKIVVAAGGKVQDSTWTDSVEILVLDDDNNQAPSSWKLAAEPMPVQLGNAASAVTSDQLQMFLIGGSHQHYNNDEGSTSIFVLECSGRTCDSWTTMQLNLRAPSLKGLAFILPSYPLEGRADTVGQNNTGSNESDGTLVLVTGMENLYAKKTVTDTIAISHNGSATPCFQDMDFFNTGVRSSHATGGLLQLPIALSSSNDIQTYYQNTPVICGGYHTNDIYTGTSFCYTIQDSDDNPIGSMSTKRCNLASVAINDGSTLWVTGGRKCAGYYANMNCLDSTDYLDVTSGVANDIASSVTLTTRVGPRLPRKMAGHCLEMISDTLAIVFGGDDGDKLIFTNSWTFDLDRRSNPTEEWVERASMSTARNGHSCGVLRGAGPEDRRIVVAVGGRAYRAIDEFFLTDTVELLYTNGPVFAPKWQLGPSFPVPIDEAASATTSGGTRMFVAGGVTDWTFQLDGSVQASSSVYYLQCPLLVCEWKTVELEPLNARIRGLAMIVPLLNKRSFSIETELPVSCEGGELCPYSGDGVCHGEYNVKECDYDGGDCCLESSDCQSCHWQWPGCQCHITGIKYCTEDDQNCDDMSVLDGICDGINNRQKCQHDGGDCCIKEGTLCSCEGNWHLCNCVLTGESYCQQSRCPNNLNHDWIADGHCDDATNIAECEFDGGDCCLPEVSAIYCKICECLT